MNRGLQRKCNTLMTRLRKDMKAAPPGERPDGVKTHVRRLEIKTHTLLSFYSFHLTFSFFYPNQTKQYDHCSRNDWQCSWRI